MGKKNKKNNAVKENPALENVAANNDAEVVVAEAEANKEPAQSKKTTKKAEVKGKKTAKKEKKENKLVRRLKETGSELKKVSWPSFKETLKKTGVVLAVVLFFGLVLFTFDYVLTVCSKLLAGGSITVVQQWVSIGLVSAVVLGAAIWLTIWLVRRKRK